jgi:hypothetical protein
MLKIPALPWRLAFTHVLKKPGNQQMMLTLLMALGDTFYIFRMIVVVP